MITSLLIANRGEIACRIIRTARRLGIATVAVYSDADADALHVREADRAVHIGPAAARESYLIGERIITAAQQSGAQAVHPGYGFLSENAEFAQAVIDAGLIWVGPNPASITAMGLTDAAKKLMADAGVPVTPGYQGDNQDAAFLAARAAEIGYPVLIKAVAGGGGKGMRLVERADAFADALASCRREAAASFGNDVVLIEKYIERPRHIEVQLFGDKHGNIVHLFERDCSLQRRHQKVIEEAPAPGMDAATRAAVCTAAVNAGRAVDYVGAGTIEFIADASEGLRADRIWFMEMNTRLQVEHPVTEAITGVDLVEWQLRVASGEPLPATQDELAIDGHAIEARLYAEDPAKGFLPATGKLEALHLSPLARADTGVEEGDTVTPYYDPMIAKLIVHRDSRDAARRGLIAALEDVLVAPLRTNQGFLARCLADEAFAAGDVHTGLIAERGDALIPPAEPSAEASDAAAALFRAARVGSPVGFRLNRAPETRIPLWHDGIEVRGDLLANARGVAAQLDQERVVVADQGHSRLFTITPPRGQGAHAAGDGAIVAPMPGKIIAVEVTEGQRVAKGDKLLTLEAMKMEHSLTAPFDGVIDELSATAGAQVQVDAVLVKVVAD